MSIGNKIMSQRKLQKMKQSELADKIGVSTRTLQRWELEEYSPTMSDISKVAQVLNIPVAELLDDTLNSSDDTDAEQSNKSGHLVFRDRDRVVDLPDTPDNRILYVQIVNAMLGKAPAVPV